MPRRTLLSLLAAIAFVWVTSACGGQQANSDPRENLDTAIDDYHTHLTWGRFNEAAGYLPVEHRNEYVGYHEEVGDDVRYTEFEVGAIDVNGEDLEARVTVTVSWFEEHSYTLRETRMSETWAFDEESEHWMLTDMTEE